MYRYVFGYQTYFIMWGVATVVGVGTAYRLAQSAGFPRLRTLAALAVLSFTLFIGAKAWYITEHWAFPGADLFTQSHQLVDLLMHGYRSPGGVAAVALTVPLICRLLGMPILRFADAVTPAVGLVVLCLRLGCFANGCCPGRLTNSSHGVRFPPNTAAFYWHVSQGLVSDLGPTLPVHPVQLYYAGLGFITFALGVWWQHAQLRRGEVWARCLLLYFGGNALLEQLQYPIYPANIVLCAVGALTSAALLMWVRSQAEP